MFSNFRKHFFFQNIFSKTFLFLNVFPVPVHIPPLAVHRFTIHRLSKEDVDRKFVFFSSYSLHNIASLSGDIPAVFSKGRYGRSYCLKYITLKLTVLIKLSYEV